MENIPSIEILKLKGGNTYLKIFGSALLATVLCSIQSKSGGD